VSTVKRAALEALRSDLAANVTGMSATGKVRAVARDSQQETPYPSIQLVAGRFQYIPRGRTEVRRVSASQVLWNVGRFDGDVELRVVADAPARREPIEEEVLARFLASSRPGTLVVNTASLTLRSTATLYASPVAYTLASTEWNEERVWERRRYSFVNAKASFEALVLDAVGSTYSMGTIYLLFTQDLHTAYPAVERTTYSITAAGPVKQ